MNETILITGVAGLLGSRMAEWLLKEQPGCKIVGIDDLSGGYSDNIPEGVIFCRLDCKRAEIREVFEEHHPAYVYHFAAYAAEGLSPFIRKFNYNSNLVATANIVNECIRSQVKRLIFTSSMAVYGRGNPPFNEDHQPAPIDPYGIAKYACEMDIQVAGEQHGLDWCIIRPHNVYGIKQNIWDAYRNVLGIWMCQHLEGQPLTIFGDGEQKRAFSFVDDCLAPLWQAATAPLASRQIINLGSGVEYSITKAAALLIKIMGGGHVAYLPQRHEVKNAHATQQKSIDLLGFKDQTDLRTGLSIMWEWARHQPLREPFVWPEYELVRGIYDYWNR